MKQLLPLVATLDNGADSMVLTHALQESRVKGTVSVPSSASVSASSPPKSPSPFFCFYPSSDCFYSTCWFTELCKAAVMASVFPSPSYPNLPISS